ncbi:ATP-binding protein [Streptomyces sp. NPDC052396]|uniref:ATP-binding protein n=1 Tax=Streptomyces sp. NPDC052396 TaxID=3365689 RepID=UPI0037CDC726
MPLPGSGLAPAISNPLSLGFDELYGREAELSLLTCLLRRRHDRLITLTGPAGVGKSRLVHAALGNGGMAHGESAEWTDLADSRDGDPVWARCGARSADEAARHIGSEELLLVLDNCDPVASSIALDIAGLLGSCPRLRVLVTSRVALDIRAERIFPVNPLPVGPGSPAEELFVNHVHPYYRPMLLAGRGPVAVTDICRELGGVPLALQMAAESVGAEGPHAVLRVLRDGSYRDRRRLRDVPKRHRTIANAMSWAGHVLTDSDRALLQALAVFRGNFDLSAAEQAVGGDREAAVRGAESLVRKSLLLRAADDGHVGEPEFRLTSMARYYFRRQLEGDPRALNTALDRHAAVCTGFALRVAHELRSGHPADRIVAQVEARLPDLWWAVQYLRARGDHAGVLRLLTALQGPLLDHGVAPQAADELEAAASVRTPGDGALAAEALMSVARRALDDGDDRRAEAALDRALKAAAELPPVRARIAALTGEVLRRRGETAAADDLLATAVDRLDAAGDPRGAAGARRSLALLRAARGERDAEKLLRLALDELVSAPARPTHPWCDTAPLAALRASLLVALARVRRELGEIAKAHADVREALRLLQHIASPGQAAEALEVTALVTVVSDTDEHRAAADRLMAHVDVLRRHYWVRAGGQAGEQVEGQDEETERLVLDQALLAGLAAPPPRVEHSDLAAPPGGSNPVQRLTKRQHEVAELVSEGLTNRQIASRLGISEWTVTNHLRTVMQKLECTSRVQVMRALQRADR